MKVVKAFILVFIYSGLAHADSRDNFINKVLPLKYPMLVEYLKQNESLKVNWVSQTGENQNQILTLNNDKAIIIKTKMYGGTTGGMNTPVSILMMDKNRDSHLDYIEYHMQDQKPHIYNNPTDETSLYLWDTSLAITMKYSSCCGK
ncbi:MAG: hypothetical protein L3J28_03540 [Candidatus Polarisedimenticolaceae bacterium]|nr:hypothetical protein [Candidatus Polarisedimenticolaceae bacterium]